MKFFHILYISFIFMFSTPLFSNQTPKLYEGFSYYGLDLSSDLFFKPILYNESDPDFDKDGVPDKEEDIDGDGNLENDDSDNDGTSNYKDNDDDNDGILTKYELTKDGAFLDTDGDNIPNHLDNNDDGDGKLTKEEHPDDNQNGKPEDAKDTDSDGIPDYLDKYNVVINTDTDKDGVPDDRETSDHTNPTEACSLKFKSQIATIIPKEWGKKDCDGDNVKNKDEKQKDSDNDGKYDILDNDDDDDTIPTQYEIGDPANPKDTDKDGTPDYLDIDDDNDGILTKYECKFNTNTKKCEDNGDEQDLDDDEVPDYLDADSDNDKIPDQDDWDDDNDGIPDFAEIKDLSSCKDKSDGITVQIITLEYLGNDCSGCDYCIENNCYEKITKYCNYLINDIKSDGKLPDRLNLDSDGDGIYDIFEAGHTDLDDKIKNREFNLGDCNLPHNPNCYDKNSNGWADTAENPENILQNTDGDENPDFQDPDDDGDGILTKEENADPNEDGNPDDAIDSDGDKTPDYLDDDDDGDGLLTKYELGNNGTPQDSDDDSIFDYLDNDDDGDGILTKDEHPDDDKNGKPDDARDSNGDGTPDYLDKDDDNDGIYTKDETGEDVNNPTDTDKDGTPDYLDPDDDGDGIPTTEECLNESKNISNKDENCKNPQDTDKDGTPDYLDPDDDGDGIPTTEEDQNKNGNPRDDFNYDPNKKIPDYKIYNKKTITGNSVFSCSYSNNKNSIFYILIFLFTMLLFKQYRRKEK